MGSTRSERQDARDLPQIFFLFAKPVWRYAPRVMSTTGEDPYRIAAMQQKVAMQYDLMRPGPGTPWEVRGGNAIGAFIKTTMRSLFTPAQLFNSLRRPETISDGKSYLWACGIMWSLGVVTNDVWSYFRYSGLADALPDQWAISPPQFWLEMVLRMVLVVVGLFVFWKIAVSVFHRLSASELKAAPRSLVQNLFAYSLGPSILAIIPPWYIGGPIAAVWILLDMILAARKRLYMSVSGSAINCILAWISGVAIIAASSAAIWFLWNYIEGHSITYTPPAAHVRPE